MKISFQKDLFKVFWKREGNPIDFGILWQRCNYCHLLRFPMALVYETWIQHWIKWHQKEHQSGDHFSEITSFRVKTAYVFPRANSMPRLTLALYIFTFCGNSPEAAYGDIFAIFQWLKYSVEKWFIFVSFTQEKLSLELLCKNVLVFIIYAALSLLSLISRTRL